MGSQSPVIWLALWCGMAHAHWAIEPPPEEPASSVVEENLSESGTPEIPLPESIDQSRNTFGPTLSLQIPHPIWLDVEKRFNAQWTGALGFGGFGITRKPQPEREFKVSIASIDVRARWHPFSGAFFLGTAFGIQSLQGSSTQPIHFTVNSTPYTINTTVDGKVITPYLTPHLGWLWQFSSGFVLGLDFGIQIPLVSKTTIDVKTDNALANAGILVLETTQEYQDLKRQIENAGNQLGQLSLPYFTVLRVGWFFDVN